MILRACANPLIVTSVVMQLREWLLLAKTCLQYVILVSYGRTQIFPMCVKSLGIRLALVTVWLCINQQWATSLWTKQMMMSYKANQCTGHHAVNTRPHQLCWLTEVRWWLLSHAETAWLWSCTIRSTHSTLKKMFLHNSLQLCNTLLLSHLSYCTENGVCTDDF